MGSYPELDAAIAAYLEKVASAIEVDARAGAPMDTGELAASISHEIQGDTARIGSNVKYALFVELGTNPHRIYSKHLPDGRLRFFWEKIGQNVAFPYVNHPGTPAQPYLAPALFRTRGAL